MSSFAHDRLWVGKVRSSFAGWIGFSVLALAAGQAEAQTCTTYPDPLTNGTTADATQVMANFNCAALLGAARFTGRVGINEPTPIAPLDVAGYMHVSGVASPVVTSQGAYLGWNALTGATGETDLINNQGGGPGGFAFMNTPPSGTPLVPLMVISGGGLVGMGTTSPAGSLDVERAANDSGTILQIGDQGGNYTFDFSRSSATGALSIQGNQPGYSNLALAPSSGYVGIGTATPGETLDVNGVVRSNNEIIGTFGGGYGQFRMIGGAYGSFLRNDGSNTYLLLTSSGNQYGTWTSARPFIVNDTTGDVEVNAAYFQQSTGYVSIGTITPISPNLLTVAGPAYATAWNSPSDARLKKHVVTVVDGLKLVEQLHPVRFDWRSRDERAVGKDLSLPADQRQIGFIAQEVEKVVPEVVTPPKGGATAPYSMNESALIPLLTQAIQEQQAEIAAQSAALGKQQAEIERLQAQVAKTGPKT